jgi:hypothetical protein
MRGALKCRSAAASCAVTCFVWVRTREGRRGPIQNDSGLAQGHATCSRYRLGVRYTDWGGEPEMRRRELVTLLGGAR